MAKTRTRGRSTKAKAPAREPRATSRKKAPAAAVADAEVIQEAPGIGTEGGVAIITTVVLLIGCLFLDYVLGANYGGGVFF